MCGEVVMYPSVCLALLKVNGLHSFELELAG